MLRAVKYEEDVTETDIKKLTGEHALVQLIDLPKWLARIVLSFKEMNDKWDDPERAVGECWAASHLFLTFVRQEVGIEGLYVEFQALGKMIPPRCKRTLVCELTNDPYYKPMLKSATGNHYGARIGPWVFDWTARQFREDDLFPRVWRWCA